MHEVQDGPASQSYGLQVAQLAGVPNHVIVQAKQKLIQLETDSVVSGSRTAVPPPPVQNDMFNSNTHPVIEKLKLLDVDNLSPREALELIYSLKSKL